MDLTIIGHSTLLFETSGVRLLTDPLFRREGLPRTENPPAIAAEGLVDVVAVLVSHNHPDHVDTDYVAELDSSTPVMAPSGMRWPRGVRPANVVDATEWEPARRFGPFRVTPVPARHPGRCVGYVIEADGEAVYFAGDTLYDPSMGRIGEDWDLDVALLPIRVVKVIPVMDWERALDATRDLHPKVVIPIHRGVSMPLPWLADPGAVRRYAAALAARPGSAEFVDLPDGVPYRVGGAAPPA